MLKLLRSASEWISPLSAILCVYLTYMTNLEANRTQVRIDLASKFDQSSLEILPIAQRFILSLNSNTDLSDAKASVSVFTAKQITDVEALKMSFTAYNSMEAYIEAVENFQKATKETTSPKDIKRWASAFDELVTSRESLSRDIRSRIGIRTI